MGRWPQSLLSFAEKVIFRYLTFQCCRGHIFSFTGESQNVVCTISINVCTYPLQKKCSITLGEVAIFIWSFVMFFAVRIFFSDFAQIRFAPSVDILVTWDVRQETGKHLGDKRLETIDRRQETEDNKLKTRDNRQETWERSQETGTFCKRLWVRIFLKIVLSGENFGWRKFFFSKMWRYCDGAKILAKITARWCVGAKI